MSTDGAAAKLAAALAQCGLHVQVLAQALAEVQPLLPFDATAVARINPLQRRLLDQIAYRFGKLQDSLGEKVLPGLLLAAQEPVAPEATFGNAEQVPRGAVIPVLGGLRRCKSSP